MLALLGNLSYDKEIMALCYRYKTIMTTNCLPILYLSAFLILQICDKDVTGTCGVQK